MENKSILAQLLADQPERTAPGSYLDPAMWGRLNLDSQVTHGLAGALRGLYGMVDFPRQYMQGGIDREAAADWAAPMALGMLGAPAGAGREAASLGIGAYHGTTKGARGKIRQEGFSVPESREPAVFFSSSPKDAYEFALMAARSKKDSKVIKADVDAKDFHRADVAGEIYYPELMERILMEARQQGAPGATIRNIQNFEYGRPSTTYAVFDPSKITGAK